MRRTSPPSSEPQVLTFCDGRLTIDPVGYRVTLDGEPIELTPVEHKLLLYLATHAGRVLTYQQILRNVWGPGYEDGHTNLKVYISRLRNKIEPDPGEPCIILTQWGVGYRMIKT
jgi:two-component system KDP operon response regulator KdpE